MDDTIFLLVKVTIATTHRNVREAVTELQQQSTCTIKNTRKVRVKRTELMDYKLKS
ncbi:hypothetical protein [Mucilaginibacter sp.]|uniref:hypothetical protein n=1 Tax=Mucilaginibacter sp. TaxID=1882438 RepID=UPI00326539C0